MEMGKEEEKINFHEFQCLGCKTIWLMEENRKPNYCPGCGGQFGSFIVKEEEVLKS